MDIDRARELADLEEIDKLCDGPFDLVEFDLVEEGYNFRLDWPDLMGTDDNDRLDEFHKILASGQFWFNRDINNGELDRTVSITERQIVHSLELMKWCLENLKTNGVDLHE